MSVTDIVATLNLGFTLKANQVKCLQKLLEGNVFAVLPTGYGKSMIYSLFPLVKSKMDGQHRCCIVISPLISIMKDQTSTLREMGIIASAINSQSSPEEIADVMDRKASVVFISPEKMLEDTWFKFFTRGPTCEDVCLLCFDEAHCISQWGLEFRKSYREVCGVTSGFTDIPVLTLTATCTTEIKQDIFDQLGFDPETCVINEVSDRPNIFLGYEQCAENLDNLSWIINEIKDKKNHAPKFIIYCRNIQSCSKLFFWAMEELGEDIFIDGDKKASSRVIDMFHSGTDSKSQSRILDIFSKTKSPLKVIFSTVSFGMGIQIADVTFVIHWGVENSMLTYWQEIGRCGRDGRDGMAITYVFPRSLSLCTDQKFKNLFTEKYCIRKFLLTSFCFEDEAYFSVGNACTGQCDVCFCHLCKCCSYCSSVCSCDGAMTLHQRIQLFI